mmetsp:Transcript_39928/g.115050  ORF Transcript_39928/g.115050 Transcript_39928/m.115050 type:complete len:232 (+) Transcript_39928:358-1053(+)
MRRPRPVLHSGKTAKRQSAAKRPEPLALRRTTSGPCASPAAIPAPIPQMLTTSPGAADRWAPGRRASSMEILAMQHSGSRRRVLLPGRAARRRVVVSRRGCSVSVRTGIGLLARTCAFRASIQQIQMRQTPTGTAWRWVTGRRDRPTGAPTSRHRGWPRIAPRSTRIAFTQDAARAEGCSASRRTTTGRSACAAAIRVRGSPTQTRRTGTAASWGRLCRVGCRPSGTSGRV